MNKKRRKLIEGAIEQIREALADLKTARDEEQEYAENVPESRTEKKEKSEGDASCLEEACDAIASAIEDAEGALQ